MANRLDAIYNFVRLSEQVGTAGQPTEDQFAAIRADGYGLVVNLALPTSPNALPDESATVTALGMEYIPIPVVWDAPAVEDALRFFEVMDVNAERKVFVHCVANMRVSAFMYLYRILRQGVAEAEAAQDLHRLWVPEGHWKEFIATILERRNRGTD